MASPMKREEETEQYIREAIAACRAVKADPGEVLLGAVMVYLRGKCNPSEVLKILREEKK